jgi:hypothetical protein
LGSCNIMRNTRAERESFLSAGRFEALLKALVGAGLDAGYAPAAVAAAERAVLAAHFYGDHGG